MIAIIALLAAILFPVFARARENARRASCQSNLKQIGLGILQYVQDYDEKLFPSIAYDGGDYNWGKRTQPYLKSIQVFRCPSDHLVNSPDSSGYFSYASTTRMSYGITIRVDSYGCSPAKRSNFGIVGDTNDIIAPFSISDFENASETLVVGEFGNDPADPVIYGTFIDPRGNPWGGAYNCNYPGTAHFDGGNSLFADGHVKFFKTGKTDVTVNGLTFYYWRTQKNSNNCLG